MSKAGRKFLAEAMETIRENLGLSPCPECTAGDHVMCRQPDGLACCCPVVTFDNVESEKRGATKSPEDITDVQSTGRKRAAVRYPITEGMVCEWEGLKSAGGGVVPIFGCLGNLATDRHHGPDKNTLNNEPGNVHRICSPCHNMWHARNDEFYGTRPPGTEPFIPLDDHKWCAHNATDRAEQEELIKAQLGRKLPKAQKVDEING